MCSCSALWSMPLLVEAPPPPEQPRGPSASIDASPIPATTKALRDFIATLVGDDRRVSKEGTELSNLVLDALDLDCQEKSQKKRNTFTHGQNQLELFCRAYCTPPH